MAEDRSLRARIIALFSIDGLKAIPDDLSAEGKTDRILHLLVLSMCFVSFLATAEGLSENVFIDHPVRAYIVSLAVQAIIFFVSVRLGRKKDKKANWREKLRAGLSAELLAELLTRFLTGLSTVAICFFALLISIVFDYTFICNLAYDRNSEGTQGNDVYLSNEYNVTLSEAERYAQSVDRKLEEELDPLYEEIKAAVGDGVVVVNVQNVSDPEAVAHRATLEDLVASHASADRLDEYIAELSTLCDQLEVSIEGQNKLADQYRSSMYYLDIYGGNVQSAVSGMEAALAEAQRLAEVRTFYQALIGIASSAKGTAGYQATSSFDDLMAQIEAPSPNSAAISESLHSIASSIVSSRGENGSLSGNLNLVHRLNRIADEYGDVGEMKTLLDQCRDYRASMSLASDAYEAEESGSAESERTASDEDAESGEQPDGDTEEAAVDVKEDGEGAGSENSIALAGSEQAEKPGPSSSSADSPDGKGTDAEAGDTTLSVRFGSEFNKQKWVENWTHALNLLRSALESAPLEDNGSTTYEIDELIARVDQLEHDRLGYIGKLEQAIQYIAPNEYPYPRLAYLCLAIALFLDFGALGIGLFANVRKKVR